MNIVFQCADSLRIEATSFSLKATNSRETRTGFCSGPVFFRLFAELTESETVSFSSAPSKGTFSRQLPFLIRFPYREFKEEEFAETLASYNHWGREEYEAFRNQCESEKASPVLFWYSLLVDHSIANQKEVFIPSLTLKRLLKCRFLKILIINNDALLNSRDDIEIPIDDVRPGRVGYVIDCIWTCVQRRSLLQYYIVKILGPRSETAERIGLVNVRCHGYRDVSDGIEDSLLSLVRLIFFRQ